MEFTLTPDGDGTRLYLVESGFATLGRAGLVAGQRRGREVRYRVRPERLSSTARWMDQVAAQWDARLSAIKRIAEDGA